MSYSNAVDSHYAYHSAEEAWSDGYLSSRVVQLLSRQSGVRRVLDAGCGNGSMAARIAAAGFDVTGFDTSPSGIAHAQAAFSGVRFEVASGYDDLRERLGRAYDACACIEVVEHLYAPRTFISRVFDVLRPGGLLIITTPYHGYVKNLALALSGKFDAHFTALWDGGHIKFWSRPTLTRLVLECGFDNIRVSGAGRVPLLWKSMILTARKP
jgi:2-polyprenyl-6-hydroxyphenyl methylase/3-demethylubiquinone-9 3-methyltransferase